MLCCVIIFVDKEQQQPDDKGPVTLDEEQQPATFKCLDCQIVFDTKAKQKYHRLKLHGKWQRGFR